MPNVDVKLLELMGKRKIRTIKELHELTGISRTVISDLLNENKRSVRLETIERLCAALECDIGDLIVLKRGDE